MSLGENGQNSDDVDARVREAILDGELAPGAVMSQVALAEELGISRTRRARSLSPDVRRRARSLPLCQDPGNTRSSAAPKTAASTPEA